jgi:hypothetical protein
MRCLAVERTVRAVVIVVILRLAQLVVEQVNVVGDAAAVEELIELLIVDAVGPLDFAVQMWRTWPDVGVLDVERLDMPVELGLKLRAIISLARR